MAKNTGKASNKTTVKATTSKRNSKKSSLAKKKKRKLLFAVEAVVLLILIGVLFVMNKVDKLNDTADVNEDNLKANEGIENIKAISEGYTNVALFGVDTREGSLGKSTHSDTIMIASINNKTGDIKLCSVYRDTYLNLSDDTYKKANQAYFNGGPEQAIKMLNMNLDLNITKYVSVDFKAVTTVVDLLGGIEIDVTDEEVPILNDYTVETSAVTGVKTTKLTEGGTHILDGVQATSYARIRYTAGGDYKRTERQRLVLEKIADKAKKANPVLLNTIVDKVLQSSVSTNFELNDILSLVGNITKYNLADQSGFPFDKTTKNWKKSIGDVVIPITLEANVSKLHEFLFNEENYSPSPTVKAISKKVIEDTGISQ